MFKLPSNSNLRLDSATNESYCACNPRFGLARSPPDLTVAILTRSQEPMAFAQVVDAHSKGSDFACQLKSRYKSSESENRANRYGQNLIEVFEF